MVKLLMIKNMKTKERLNEAIMNLFAGKLRSILAILGILIGTASVVAMLSIGQLATQQILSEFKKLGTNLLSVSLYLDETSTSKKKLNLETALKLKTVSSNIIETAPYSISSETIQYRGHEIDDAIVGVTEQFFDIFKLKVQQGRFIYYLDRFSPFCAIGNNIYQQIMTYTTINPYKKQIKLKKNFFTIVGIIEATDENAFFETDINTSVFIPIQTLKLLGKKLDIGHIIIKLKPNTNIEQIKKLITSYFTKHAPNKKLFFNSAKELVVTMKKQQEILTIFLGIIAAISLLVGGIGVMNIMLVSVIERRKEIGIRLAIGAKCRDIQSLFLIEAVTLTLFGGTLGVLLGICASFIVALFKDWQFSLFFIPIVIGFSVSVITGIFFGFYPAYKASKLDPIKALRAE
jgi:putative ABC transport system permease protein